MAHQDDLERPILITHLVHRGTFRTKNNETLKVRRPMNYGFYQTQDSDGGATPGGGNMYVGSYDQLILGANIDRNDEKYDRIMFTEDQNAPSAGYEVLKDRTPDNDPTQGYNGPIHYKATFGDV